MTNVVIASAARTAVGSFSGSFANTPAHDLGATAIEAVVERAGVDKAEVSVPGFVPWPLALSTSSSAMRILWLLVVRRA